MKLLSKKDASSVRLFERLCEQEESTMSFVSTPKSHHILTDYVFVLSEGYRMDIKSKKSEVLGSLVLSVSYNLSKIFEFQEHVQ
jgi:hypothetical protein